MHIIVDSYYNIQASENCIIQVNNSIYFYLKNDL